MNKSLKNIIAREGLIIIGIILASILIVYIPAIYLAIDNFIGVKLLGRRIIWEEAPTLVQNIGYFGWFFLICAYPLYLLIRFIVWAIKTLKD